MQTVSNPPAPKPIVVSTCCPTCNCRFRDEVFLTEQGAAQYYRPIGASQTTFFPMGLNSAMNKFGPLLGMASLILMLIA